MDWSPIKDKAAGIGFLALLGAISYIASLFLPIPPGMDSIKLIGTVAAVAGAAMAMVLKRSLEAMRLAITILLALVICVLSLKFYHTVAYGQPGQTAELLLYICTCGIFAPYGFVASLAGVKLAGHSSD